MKKNLSLVCLFAVLVVCSSFSQNKPADPVSLGELLKANCYSFEVKDGNLSGTGLEFLLHATETTQFLVIGEPHNANEVPKITTLLFRVLQGRRGFGYLALEQDPIMAQMVSSRGVAGNRERVISLARRYPNAFTFISDQEIEMIAEVGSSGETKGNKIWGIDQVFGPVHVLERLIAFAPNEAVRNRTLKLVETFKQNESERLKRLERYTMLEAGQNDELGQLLNDYRPKKSSEADFLVSQMILSAKIYQNHRLVESGQLTGYDSNFEREENMKWLFMKEYRKAQTSGERLPRVLVKSGHYHALRRRSWSNVLSLGNFLSEFAKSNGMNSFHLALYINNASGDYGVLSSDAEYRQLAEAAPTDRWTVIDLRPLKKYAHAGKLTGASSELRRIIFGFDAALIIGRGSRGTFKLVTAPRVGSQ